MEDTLHELAPHHLPGFIPGPDGSDPMFTSVTIGAIAIFVLLGIFYLTLHAIPERMAHKSNHMQLQLISILAVLALFTHNNLFWVIAILIAAVRVPDFMTPLESMSRSLARMAWREEPATAPVEDGRHDG
ncbi:hypothetical protein AB1M95_10065 [Sulfitobacter sp. LCG007]